eukprot:6191717-Pleurochrysis_carterae.AAC.3
MSHARPCVLAADSFGPAAVASPPRACALLAQGYDLQGRRRFQLRVIFSVLGDLEQCSQCCSCSCS